MHDLLRNQLFNNRQWKPQEFFANKLLASSRRTPTSLSLPLLFDFRLLMLPVWVVSVGGWVAGGSMAGRSLDGHLIKSMTKLRQLKASCSNWSSLYIAYTQRCLLVLSNCR